MSSSRHVRNPNDEHCYSSFTGSVSATVWSIVCKKVAGILARVVVQWVPNPFDSPIWNGRGEKGEWMRHVPDV